MVIIESRAPSANLPNFIQDPPSVRAGQLNVDTLMVAAKACTLFQIAGGPAVVERVSEDTPLPPAEVLHTLAHLAVIHGEAFTSCGMFDQANRGYYNAIKLNSHCPPGVTRDLGSLIILYASARSFGLEQAKLESTQAALELGLNCHDNGPRPTSDSTVGYDDAEFASVSHTLEIVHALIQTALDIVQVHAVDGGPGLDDVFYDMQVAARQQIGQHFRQLPAAATLKWPNPLFEC